VGLIFQSSVRLLRPELFCLLIDPSFNYLPRERWKRIAYKSVFVRVHLWLNLLLFGAFAFLLSFGASLELGAWCLELSYPMFES
jgi:hypothetical protein